MKRCLPISVLDGEVGQRIEIVGLGVNRDGIVVASNSSPLPAAMWISLRRRLTPCNARWRLPPPPLAATISYNAIATASRIVVLPAPFTPTKTLTSGCRVWRAIQSNENWLYRCESVSWLDPLATARRVAAYATTDALNRLPTLRPPEMQGGRVAMADRFLAGGGDVDRFEREGDFDDFFLVWVKAMTSSFGFY